MEPDLIDLLIADSLIQIEKPKFNIESFLFKEQLELVRDPSKFATAVCSVRAGKTIACAADLIDTALTKPGTVGLYITLARSSAKRIVWPELHKINREFKLEGIPNESDLSFRFPNGSIIYCSGASDAQEIEKFRGLSNVALSYLDECFDGDTLIETKKGSVKIKDIKVGDTVKNAIGYGKVVSLSAKQKDKCVKLVYNGKIIRCSLNHPFFTINGWVSAKDLKIGDLLARQSFSVRLLQEIIHKDDSRKQNLSFLQSELLREVSTTKNQSNEQSGNKSEDDSNYSPNGTQALSEKREWHWINRRRKSIAFISASNVLELCSFAWQETKRLSDKLQIRFRLSSCKAWNRSRWPISLFKERPRQEKGREADFIRLDHIEIQECRSDTTNKCGLFYDIGVEGHPSFTVNGALVHNCQAFRSHIKELVEEILIKRLYDTNGRLRLIGTPGPIPSGYFHDASKSDKWSHHAWTLHSNPWIEKKSGCSVAQLIQQDCDRKGVTIDDPSIQRECFGRWVLDSTSLLLNYDPVLNDYDVLPKGNYNFILGMDFGFDDADSFTVLGFSDSSPNTYLIEEIVKERQTYDQMAQTFDALYKKYDFCKIVADPGGGGKKLIESLKQRYPIPMEPADKLGKIANYGLLNNSLRSGRFYAKKDSRFAQDCNLLEKDRDKSTPDKTIVKGHSDAVDSCLYAFKESPAYGYTPPIAKPKVGTKEYEDKIAQELFEHHLEKMEKERQNKDGDGRNWESDSNMESVWHKW
jgi:hypothetical protein